jgi:hypothetical protein
VSLLGGGASPRPVLISSLQGVHLFYHKVGLALCSLRRPRRPKILPMGVDLCVRESFSVLVANRFPNAYLSSTLEVNMALTCNCAIFFPAVWRACKTVFSIGSVGSSAKSSGYAAGSLSTRFTPKDSDKRSNISRDSERPLGPGAVEMGGMEGER